jgi:hypothetical protein
VEELTMHLRSPAIRAALVFCGAVLMTTAAPPAQARDPVPALTTAAGAKKTALANVRSLDSRQIAELERAGVRTLARLVTLQPSTLARYLAINETAAAGVLRDAQIEDARLRRLYVEASARYTSKPFALHEQPRSGEADRYARLVEPVNECTILVRKVCGSHNQCSASAGCALARQVLDLFNKGGDDRQTATEACLLSLEDGLIFPACTTP